MSVSSLLNEMPPKVRTGYDKGRLLGLERDLQSENILIFCRSGFPFGTLVVTTNRLIVLLQDGGVDVTQFSDVSSFDLIEGSKKMLGGYSHTFLNTNLRNGTRVSGQILSGDAPWAMRCGRTIIAAHERYSLHGPATTQSPAAGRPHQAGSITAPHSSTATPHANSSTANVRHSASLGITCNNPRCDAFGLETPLKFCDVCGQPTMKPAVARQRPTAITYETWSRTCTSPGCDAMQIPTNQSICDVCGSETV